MMEATMLDDHVLAPADGAIGAFWPTDGAPGDGTEYTGGGYVEGEGPCPPDCSGGRTDVRMNPGFMLQPMGPDTFFTYENNNPVEDFISTKKETIGPTQPSTLDRILGIGKSVLDVVAAQKEQNAAQINATTYTRVASNPSAVGNNTGIMFAVVAVFVGLLVFMEWKS